jgi:hypothetical protein
MSHDSDDDRRRRVHRLRTTWRKGPAKAEGVSAADEVEGDRTRRDTLTSNDRIRAEAPDDLETRRRSDQLEREIKNRDTRGA